MFWTYNRYFTTPIPREYQLSLSSQESSTPLYPLDKAESIWIKDESKNAGGTHKDRSFRYWISWLYAQGIKEATLSSSGSSAFAGALYAAKAGIKLTVFLRHDFPSNEVATLRQFGAIVRQSKTPKRDAISFSKEKSIPLLRASTNSIAKEGYKTLGFEIAEQKKSVTEIFVPTSSGSTLLGIYEAYRVLQTEQHILMPRFYAVQTTMVHPIAEEYENTFREESSHPSRAIIDRIANQKPEVLNVLRETKGGAYVISTQELLDIKKVYQTQLEGHGAESALSLAAIEKHRVTHPEFQDATTVALFTN